MSEACHTGLRASPKPRRRFGMIVRMFVANTQRVLGIDPGLTRCGYAVLDAHGPTTELVSIVVEDVKGMKTPVYRLKKKIVEALYPGVVITEVN